MDKLGPGSDESTVQVLRTLPKASFQTIVDAGCGAGRQTLALARVLGTRIHALDSHRPFLDHLGRRAGEAGLGHLVQMHCMDMKDIPQVFNDIDLLWSEGAAYSIGFHSALESWRAALRGEGFAVLSELSWLRDKAPPSAKTFFESCYPGMRSVGGNAALAEAGLSPAGHAYAPARGLDRGVLRCARTQGRVAARPSGCLGARPRIGNTERDRDLPAEGG
jgi:SAM-dependent methyltransferase